MSFTSLEQVYFHENDLFFIQYKLFTFVFMIRLSVFIFISLFSLSFRAVFARSHADDVELGERIYTMSRELPDHFVYAADRIDSLKATLSKEEVEVNKHYFDYTVAYVAYVKGYYEKALCYSSSALEHFLYNGEDEWVARCLMLIGHTASAKRFIPESAKAYRMAIKFSKDPYTLSATYLSLSRVLNSMKHEWKQSLNYADYYAKLTNDEGLSLYRQLVTYWLHPDSAQMPEDIPLLASRFNELKCFGREADAYKCLVFYYLNKKDYDNALEFTNKSIEAYNAEACPPKYLLSSIHYLKGQVLVLLDRWDDAFLEFNRAIVINENAMIKGNSYHIYRTLYDHSYEAKNYEDAIFYLKQCNKSFERIANDKQRLYNRMAAIFTKISIIESELKDVKAQSTRRIALVSFLLIVFFSAIIIRLRFRKRHFEKRSVDMEGKNSMLKQQTGEFLMKAGQNAIKDKVLSTHNDLEKQLDKYLTSNHNLPVDLKGKFAETILCFEVKLDMLSQTEKRYAVMIAIGVPYKMMAEIFNVQPRTVAQYRNRIRKKMGISNTDIDLEQHLKTFLDS